MMATRPRNNGLTMPERIGLLLQMVGMSSVIRVAKSIKIGLEYAVISSTTSIECSKKRDISPKLALLASHPTRKLCIFHDAKSKLPPMPAKSVTHPEAICRALRKSFSYIFPVLNST